MNSALAADIGKRIRKLRKARGWSQAELARRLKVNKSTVGFYETGERSPSFEVLLRMCDVFLVTTDYILRGLESPDNAISALPDEQAAAIQTLLAALRARNEG